MNPFEEGLEATWLIAVKLAYRKSREGEITDPSDPTSVNLFVTLFLGEGQLQRTQKGITHMSS